MKNRWHFREGDLTSALGLFGRTLIAAVAGFFVFMSIELLFTGIFTSRIGYHVELYAPSSEKIIDEPFYFDNLDAVYKALEEKGFVLNKDNTVSPVTSTTEATTGTGSTTTATGNEDAAPTEAGDPTTSATEGTTGTTAAEPTYKLFMTEIRTELDGGMFVLSRVVSQLCMAVLYITLLYGPAWSLGDKDRNLEQFERAERDPWRGVRLGLLASIPALVAYALFLLSRFGLLWPSFVGPYRFCHFAFFPVYLWLVPNGVTLTVDMPWLSVLGLLALVLTLPVVTGIGYHLGHRQVSVADRVMYQKKKK